MYTNALFDSVSYDRVIRSEIDYRADRIAEGVRGGRRNRRGAVVRRRDRATGTRG